MVNPASHSFVSAPLWAKIQSPKGLVDASAREREAGWYPGEESNLRPRV